MIEPCPVVRCGMHLRMSTWLDAGTIEQAREFAPLLDRLRNTSWKDCTCRLYERVREALAL